VLQRTAGKGIFSNTELFCFFQTSQEAAAKCCGLIVSHPLHDTKKQQKLASVEI
jgi:hypothetical protein